MYNTKAGEPFGPPACHHLSPPQKYSATQHTSRITTPITATDTTKAWSSYMVCLPFSGGGQGGIALPPGAYCYSIAFNTAFNFLAVSPR